MSEAKMTTKGQITIPKAVRERLNLQPGDRVYFKEEDDGTVSLVPRNRPFERLMGLLKGGNGRSVTIEEMDPGNPANGPYRHMVEPDDE